MLTAIVAFCIIAQPSLTNGGVSSRIELGTIKTTKTISGEDREVNVTRYATLVAETESLGESPIRAYRDLNIRLEQPGEIFTIANVFNQVELNESSLTNAYFALIDHGASVTVGAEMYRGIKECIAVLQNFDGKNSITIDPNKGIQPDGWTARSYGHKEISAFSLLQIYDEWDNGSNPVKESIFSTKIELGKLFVPNTEPYRDVFIADGQPNKNKQVTMGGITLEPITTGVNVQLGLPRISGVWGEFPSSQTASGYIADVAKENGTQAFTSLQTIGYTPSKMVSMLGKLAPEGRDMNRLNFVDPDEGDPCAYDFDAPPGTIWLPSDGSYQTMMTGVRFNFRQMPFDLFISIDGLGLQDSGMRTLCMNMGKKEPAKGIKYFPYRPNDAVITMLANRMDESNFRGAWDQARLWIYTDKATIEDINEKLAGGVGPAAYLMALADVAWVGGIEDRMLKDSRYIKPEFMVGSAAPDYASEFLMATLDRYHGKRAGEWLKKNTAQALKLVAPDSDDDDQDHLVDTLTQMIQFSASEDRESALELIYKSQSQLANLKGKFGSGRVSLYSGRASEVLIALELTKAGFLKPARDALQYVAEKGPGETNIKLAKELLEN